MINDEQIVAGRLSDAQLWAIRETWAGQPGQVGDLVRSLLGHIDVQAGRGDYPDVNGLPLGSRWYTSNHSPARPERMATLRGLLVGTVPRGRNRRGFVIIESPPDSGVLTTMTLDDFLAEWWQP